MEESSDDHSDDSQPDYEGYAASNIGNNPDQWEHLCEYLQSFLLSVSLF